MLDHLQLQGFIIRARGHEKSRKGKGTSAEPLFKLVAEKQLVFGSIFRPEMDIAHKVSSLVFWEICGISMTPANGYPAQPARVCVS